MKVSQISSFSKNSNGQKKQAQFPTLKAKVEVVGKELLEEQLQIYPPAAKKAIKKTLLAVEKHFSKLGSDYLNIQMGIRNTMGIVDEGGHYLAIWANFKPMKEAKEHLLSKYGFSLRSSQQKQISKEKPNLFKSLEYGEHIFLKPMALSTASGIEKFADETFYENIEIIKNLYTKEAGEGKIFKRLVDHNTGLIKFIKKVFLID